MMFPRDRQPELMDDPKLPRDEHQHALKGLARLNRSSGVAGTMYRHLRRHALARENRVLNVLDVASGGGDVPLSWARRARRDGVNLQLTLLDVSGVAVEQQQRSARELGLDVLSLQQDCLDSPLPGGFDMVTCSLFMHHLDDHQAFRLLQSMQAATESGIMICDLDRSRLNLFLVNLASRVLTRSPVVHNDADASVRGAYTMEEFKDLAENALARPVHVVRAFPCRFLAMVEEETVAAAVPAFA